MKIRHQIKLFLYYYTVDDTMNECFKIPLFIKDINNHPHTEYETIKEVDHTISIHNLLHTVVETSHIKKNNASFLNLFRAEKRNSKCPVTRMTEYFQMNLTRQAMSQFSYIDQNHQENGVISNITLDVDDVNGLIGEPEQAISFFHYVNIQKPVFVTLMNGIRIIYYSLDGELFKSLTNMYRSKFCQNNLTNR